MIITDIVAQDILKYRTLKIHDIPEKGIVAIDGLNESGKSSIGETICFALYGRSFSLEQDELVKLIRWGESRCSVSLQFRNGEGKHYEINRFIDRDGNHGVRLSYVDQQDDPLARGEMPVEKALREILGFGYEEFIESFYLAQREITTPHPHSDAVKSMAGIKLLEQVSDEFKHEIEEEQVAIIETQENLEENERDQQALEIEQGLLDYLETEQQSASESLQSMQEEQQALAAASDQYQKNIPVLRQCKKSRGRSRLFLFLSLALAVSLGLCWWLLVQMPEHELSQFLSTEITNRIPQWQSQYHDWLLYGAGAFAVLLIVFWIKSATLSSRIIKLKRISPQLAEKLVQAHERQSPSRELEFEFESTDDSDEGSELASAADDVEIDTSDDAALTAVSDSEETESDLADQSSGALSSVMLTDDHRPAADEVNRLLERIRSTDAEPDEVSDLVTRELAWFDDESQQQQLYIDQIGQAIDTESERLKIDEHHNEIRETYQQQVAEHEQRIHHRNIAIELLQGTSRQVSHNFNRDLRELAGRTLPMFTEGRYEHLKIDEALNVHVFSNDKRDFMDLEEVSSGTQRQIMLAVRLALSQELVNGSVKGKQFVFLDEPFAFFDQERTRSALNVLPKLSKEITQIWVVAQSFPEDYEFEQSISCTIGEDELVAEITGE